MPNVIILGDVPTLELRGVVDTIYLNGHVGGEISLIGCRNVELKDAVTAHKPRRAVGRVVKIESPTAFLFEQDSGDEPLQSWIVEPCKIVADRDGSMVPFKANITAMEPAGRRLRIRHAKHKGLRHGDGCWLVPRKGPQGVRLVDCTNCKLTGVRSYDSQQMAFVERRCSNTIYWGCQAVRANADGYHSNGAMVAPSYIQCAARFICDDAFNVYAPACGVIESGIVGAFNESPPGAVAITDPGIVEPLRAKAAALFKLTPTVYSRATFWRLDTAGNRPGELIYSSVPTFGEIEGTTVTDCYSRWMLPRALGMRIGNNYVARCYDPTINVAESRNWWEGPVGVPVFIDQPGYE